MQEGTPEAANASAHGATGATTTDSRIAKARITRSDGTTVIGHMEVSLHFTAD